MILFSIMAFAGGILVGLSRQVNGRLALSTSAMESSFWNHAVGFVFLCVIVLIFGGLMPTQHAFDVPLIAYAGGMVGVVFIAASSWIIARIGAAQTAVLVIAGQMVSGVALDIILDNAGNPIARTAGVALILTGIFLGRRKKN
ncbi:hypothetical protein BVC71_10555 [Marivivens niveibacter]|uniref:EamA-like transporter family protein n=1 Tax=Marivivens niveibacter TaxID=1930667 RepID=A0A251WXH6_9RHOB|nr:DMT family transporter [Marivivens niveibacter]OUD09137.1 hypothetical protein BVC71_10555 [Marivivens niveibacter]